MRILAIESSSQQGGVAALENGQLVYSQELPNRSAQHLAPAIELLLGETQWTSHQLDGIAVNIGPGSFTGLRVGVVTAKTMAWAIDRPVAAIDLFSCLAEQARSHLDGVGTLCCASNAYRGEVFAAQFRLTDLGELERLQTAGSPTTPIEDWLKQAAQATWTTGPALTLPGVVPQLANRLPEPIWMPRAATIGVLGAKVVSAQQGLDPMQVTPDYGRLSAAEEKLR